jgi:hypothetical protein
VAEDPRIKRKEKPDSLIAKPQNERDVKTDAPKWRQVLKLDMGKPIVLPYTNYSIGALTA